MHFKKNIIYLLILFSFASLIVNCGGEDVNNDENNDTVISNITDKTYKFRDKLFTIPSPFHISDLIKETSLNYREDILNPSENKINYTTTERKAINLGVYTADLGYVNVYEQVSPTAKYIKVVRSLSNELQIMNAYTEEILDEIETNHQNKDTLYKIFAESYREADVYLSDNDRNDIGALIMTGGWIEGLYILTRITDQNKNKSLINRIGEQKYSLENILKILNQYKKKQDTFTNDLISQLWDLKEIFDKIEIKYTYDKQIVLPKEKKTIIISNTEIIIKDDILNEISSKTGTIRNFITK